MRVTDAAGDRRAKLREFEIELGLVAHLPEVEGREVVTWADVLQARYLRRVGEHEQVEFIERERHAVAIHEACHAVTAYLKRRSMEIDFVSIEPGGDYLGVVMSMYDELSVARAAMGAGANGFVLKRAIGTDMLNAIASVLRGESYISPYVESARTNAPATPKENGR